MEVKKKKIKKEAEAKIGAEAKILILMWSTSKQWPKTNKVQSLPYS